MSEEGFKNSLVPQIDVAKAAGFSDLIFVPGKIGERIATEWGTAERSHGADQQLHRLHARSGG
jgi:cobalt-precorrin-5B (C1)-methyltransferase